MGKFLSLFPDFGCYFGEQGTFVVRTLLGGSPLLDSRPRYTSEKAGFRKPKTSVSREIFPYYLCEHLVNFRNHRMLI